MNEIKIRSLNSAGKNRNFALGGINFPSGTGNSVTEDFVNRFMDPLTAASVAASATAGAISGKNPNSPWVPLANLVGPGLSAARFVADMGKNKGEGISGSALNLAAELALQLGAHKAAKAAVSRLSRSPGVPANPSVYQPNEAPVVYQSPDARIYNNPNGRDYFSRARNFAFGWTPGGSGSASTSGSGSTSSSGSGSTSSSGSAYNIKVDGASLGTISEAEAAKGLGSGLYKRSGTGNDLELDITNAGALRMGSPGMFKYMLPKGKLGREIDNTLLGTLRNPGYRDFYAGLTDPKYAVARVYANDYPKFKATQFTGREGWARYIPFTEARRKYKEDKALYKSLLNRAETDAYRGEDTDYAMHTGNLHNNLSDILSDLSYNLKTGGTSLAEGLQGLYGGENSGGSSWASRNREGVLTGLGALGILGLLGYGLYRGRQNDNMMRGYYVQ